MKAYLNKWLQTIRISLSFYLNYKFNFILQIFGPVIVFFIVKVNLWKAIFNSSDTGIVNSYSLTAMISYHGWAMVVQLVGNGYTGTHLAEDIRLGRISSYLIYPIHLWEFHTGQFIAFQFIQFFSAILFLLVLSFTNILILPLNSELFFGVIYLLGVSFFWFVLQYFTGLMAFYLEETWIFRVLIQVMVAFLSGLVMPLEFFPLWFQEIVFYTPFPYLSYYPVKILMGEISFSWSYLGILALWILPVILVNKIIWNKGLKNYTAAGM